LITPDYPVGLDELDSFVTKRFKREKAFTNKDNIVNGQLPLEIIAAAGTSVVSSISLIKYKIRKLVTNADSHKYNIRKLVTNSDILKYNIRKLVSQSDSYIYKIRKLVTQADTIKYKIRKLVTNADSHKYNILQTVGSHSIKFDVVDDFITCGIEAGLWSQTLPKFSFSMWAYMKSTIVTNARVIDHNLSNNGGFGIFIPSSTSAHFRVRTAAGTNHFGTATGLPSLADRWVHFVGVFDSTLPSNNVKIYVDGTAGATQDTLTASLVGIVNSLHISSGYLSNTGINGYAKDFRWWTTKALTQTEINDIKANSPSAPTPDYWLKMTEGTGNPVDSITGTKTGVLTSGASWGSGAPVVWEGRMSFVRYKLAKLVTNADTIKYNIRKLVTNADSHKYNIRKLVTQSDSYIYKIRKLVSQSDSYIYKIRKLVTQSDSHRYKIRKLVTNSDIHKYNIRKLVSQSDSYIYNICKLVTQSDSHKYNIHKLISKTGIHKYNILVQIASSQLISKYNLRKLVSKSNTLTYKLRELVTSSSTISYNIRQLVSSPSTYKYNVRKLVSSTNTIIYNIISELAIVSSILASKYNIRQLISQTSTQKYNIRKLVTSSSIVKYNIRMLVTVSNSFVYNILFDLIIVSSILSSKYNIRKLVTKTSTQLYNILSNIIIVPPAPSGGGGMGQFGLPKLRKKKEQELLVIVSSTLTCSYRILELEKSVLAEALAASKRLKQLQLQMSRYQTTKIVDPPYFAPKVSTYIEPIGKPKPPKQELIFPKQERYVKPIIKQKPKSVPIPILYRPKNSHKLLLKKLIKILGIEEYI
jgi:uncharacterized coiled-coil DUF342 family protein